MLHVIPATQVDRWLPDYRRHGFTFTEAAHIVKRCLQLQRAQPAREWTDILSQAVEEHDHGPTA